MSDPKPTRLARLAARLTTTRALIAAYQRLIRVFILPTATLAIYDSALLLFAATHVPTPPSIRDLATTARIMAAGPLAQRLVDRFGEQCAELEVMRTEALNVGVLGEEAVAVRERGVRVLVGVMLDEVLGMLGGFNEGVARGLRERAHVRVMLGEQGEYADVVELVGIFNQLRTVEDAGLA